MEANNIQIPFSGMSTNRNYQDGECYSLVNLRPKNGTLQPVTPCKADRTLSRDYDIIFLHQNNDHQNWIGVENNTGASGTDARIFSHIRDTPVEIVTLSNTTVTAIEQIGYSLSVITDREVYYIFFKDGAYVYYGAVPDLPPVKVSTGKGTEIYMYYTKEYGMNTIMESNFVETTKGLINKARKTNDEENWAQLYDVHLLRYAFRMFDGSLVKHSSPILIMPPDKLVSRCAANYGLYNTGYLRSESYVWQAGWKMELEYDFQALLEKWKDVIDSIDFFLSPAIGVTAPDNTKESYYIFLQDAQNDTNCFQITSQNVVDAQEMANFYLIRSVKADSIFFEFPKGEDVNVMENLIFKEQMSNDMLSHHTYGTKTSYCYNNRLHLGYASTTLFGGFTINHFSWNSARYNGSVSVPVNYSQVLIETEIQVGASLEKTYTLANSTGNYGFWLGSYVSYPDPRARRMTFYALAADGNWVRGRSISLQPHSFLNIACYVNDDFNALRIGNSTPITMDIDYEKKVTFYENNKLRVSEVNNPLTFIHSYLVGSGSIVALASNVMNVADRNYGQYPLYVFTDQGVWNLQQGADDAVYANVISPTYNNGVISPVVCHTPYGVVFASNKGLYSINGIEVTYLSAQMEEKISPLARHGVPAALLNAIPDYGTVRFRNFIKTLKDMAFDVEENELIITSSEHSVNFVLNFDSGSFYLLTEPIHTVVRNTFPGLWTVGNRVLKNRHQTEEGHVHIGLITRPVRLNTLQVKRVDRFILRCLLHDVQHIDPATPTIAEISNSKDGINFNAVQGLGLKQGSQTDIDSNLFSSLKDKYYQFCLGGVVRSDSVIKYLEMEAALQYTGSKMR